MTSSRIIPILLIGLLYAPTSGLAITPDRLCMPPGSFDALGYTLIYAVRQLHQNIPATTIEQWVPTASVGRPSRGALLFARAMKPSTNIYIRNPNEAWIVPEGERLLRAAHAAVRKAHPGTPDLGVGDISRRHGGRFRPHHTHRNGRDCDLRYYLKNVKPGDHERHDVSPYSFDSARVWTFITFIHQSGQADAILIDSRHQKLLWKYARKTLKMTRAELKPILSYPAQRRRSALVKHAEGHYNHIHIRFKAPVARIIGWFFNRADARRINRELDLKRQGHFELVVQRGDTLGSIARRHHVQVDDLLKWNKLKRANQIRPGKRLRIYAPSAQ